MGRTALVVAALLLAPGVGAQPAAIEATTATGEKVRLFRDGRWEYADPVKAEPQKKAREATEAEMRERERGAQGGWFGFGRRVYEGDKEYNRGSLNPVRR